MFKRNLSILTLIFCLFAICLSVYADEASMLKEANSYIVKDHAKAIELYKKVLEINPKSAEANYNIGALYLWDNKPEISLSYLQNTLQYNPKYPLAYSAIAVNCDLLAEYDMTLKYIEKYRNEYPNDKLNNELADKFLLTSKSKQKYSEKLVKRLIPKVKMEIAAPKWVLAYKEDAEKHKLSVLTIKNAKIDSSPESLVFFEIKNCNINPLGKEKTISALMLMSNVANTLPRSRYSVIESKDDYIISETQNYKEYHLSMYKAGKNSVYLVKYVLMPNDIYPERKQYWINQFKKIQFIE